VAGGTNGEKKLFGAVAGFAGIVATVGYITLGSMLFAGKQTEADVTSLKAAAEQERHERDARLAELKGDISEIKADIKTLLERYAGLEATVRAELARRPGTRANPH